MVSGLIHPTNAADDILPTTYISNRLVAYIGYSAVRGPMKEQILLV